MAINMMCMNSKCKYYYEDNCTRNINEERIEVDENGMCETFEEVLEESLDVHCIDKFGNVTCSMGDVVKNDYVMFTVGYINHNTKMVFMDKDKPMKILKDTPMKGCIEQGNFGTLAYYLKFAKWDDEEV